MCISGVADQLQTNYASDLRRILKTVFLLNQTPATDLEEDPLPPVKEGKTNLADHDAHSTSNGQHSIIVIFIIATNVNYVIKMYTDLIKS